MAPILAAALCATQAEPPNVNPGAFDQDPNSAWRTLADEPGCLTTAADMVQQYREQAERSLPPLYWREAQLRVLHGDTAEAVALTCRA